MESEVERENKLDDDAHIKKISDIKSYWDEKREQLKMTEDLTGLSKNQKKKLLKKKVFMETRMDRRKQEREKNKLKRAQKKEAGLPLPESRRSKKRRKFEFSNYKVVIDLDFYELMNDRDLRMLLKQVKACYSENRKQDHPVQLCVTSFKEQLKDLFIQLQPGLTNWDLRMEDQSYLDLFEKEKIVYLTSDSENILETLEEDKHYIIGGLVDHNQFKGLCHKRAKESAIAHAQLPIGQFVKMKSRKVLTINHVFEILLAYSTTKDWRDAFFKVLPNRKGVSDICDESCVEKKDDPTSCYVIDVCDEGHIKNHAVDECTNYEDTDINFGRLDHDSNRSASREGNSLNVERCSENDKKKNNDYFNNLCENLVEISHCTYDGNEASR